MFPVCSSVGANVKGASRWYLNILPFRGIRVTSEDETLARTTNLILGRAAYETAVRLYPPDLIHRRNGVHIIARSDENESKGSPISTGHFLQGHASCIATMANAMKSRCVSSGCASPNLSTTSLSC